MDHQCAAGHRQLDEGGEQDGLPVVAAGLGQVDMQEETQARNDLKQGKSEDIRFGRS